jgi:IS5 family transposase
MGVVMSDVQRKLDSDRAAVTAGAPAHDTSSPKPFGDLATLKERAERIRTQQRHTKYKLYVLHAPEVECISKSMASIPYELGVKVSLVVTPKQGLMVRARSFPGNPYDGHVLTVQLEQTTNLLQDSGRAPKQVIVDLGYRGVDADNPGVQIIHLGEYKSLSDHEKRLLKRRQAIEPLSGHTKADHRMDRCWLQGAAGDALHALSCAAAYNIRWLKRAIVRLGLGGLLLPCGGAYLWPGHTRDAADCPTSTGVPWQAPPHRTTPDASISRGSRWMNFAGPTIYAREFESRLRF